MIRELELSPPEKQIDPAGIKLHGEAVKGYVVTKIEQAENKINGDGVYNLEGGDFSVTLSPMALAYPIATQFAFENIDALKKEAQEMASKLGTTALTYQKAEQANM